MERAIRYVRDSFWAGRHFTTLAECNRQAWLWRDEVAHQRRWPGGDHRTVAEAFAEEQPRLLPPAQQAFPTERIVPVHTRKTIYVRFDQNDYSIPPQAVGRPLTQEALERNRPRASSVAFLLGRQPRSTPLALDMSRHPHVAFLHVRPHDLETYDALARHRQNKEGGDDDEQ